jgi:predicted RNase H-like HicB family nuclease
LGGSLKIKIVVHEAEEGGYWAEVPAVPGCVTQGETMDELLANVHEAIEACLSAELHQPERNSTDRIIEVAL